MPRTPLLQQLLRAARPDATSGISRRDFLALGAAGVALAACDATDRVAGVIPSRPSFGVLPSTRVAIVGGGLAGLTCAYRLRQRGIIATVYEGNSRLGGRCWTRRGDFAAGQIAEHGGELIDQSHTEIRHLAQEVGLTLDNLLAAEVNGTDPTYWFDGAGYTYAEATRDLKVIWQIIHKDLSLASYPTLYNSYTQRGYELDHMSLAQWIEQSVPGGRASRLGQLLETAYVIEYGADAEQQSALNLIYLLGYSGQGQLRIFGPSNEKYHVRGGNDLIVQRLVSSLDPSQIVTGSSLVAIAKTAGGAYSLTLEQGASRRAVTVDHVVLALPFSVMRASVDFAAAGFNQVKLSAIGELGMGANAKLNVQFSSRHWTTLDSNGETYADTGYQNTWEVSRGQSGGAGILVQYTGGSVTLAQGGQTVDALRSDFLSRIEPVLPGLSARFNGRATLDYWPSNPWSLGSYAYWKVGQYTSIAGAERERSGNCHFAGEHTSVDSQGYLNGAVESGERAATEILSDLKSKAA